MACRLCLRDKPLIKSHIISKFLWKPLKHEEGKFYALSAGERNVEFKMQDGPKEPMLCEDCDQQIGRYEQYVRQVLYGKPEEGDYGFRIHEVKGGLCLTGLDYAKFKLFQLSILWRAHTSTNRFFQEIKLGRHAEQMREMLVNENPGRPTDYGCFVLGVLDEPGEILDNAILSPAAQRIDNHRCYRLFFGGYFWVFIVSAHSNEIRHQEMLIGPAGELTVPFQQRSEIKFFGDMAKDFRDRGLI